MGKTKQFLYYVLIDKCRTGIVPGVDALPAIVNNTNQDMYDLVKAATDGASGAVWKGYDTPEECEEAIRRWRDARKLLAASRAKDKLNSDPPPPATGKSLKRERDDPSGGGALISF